MAGAWKDQGEPNRAESSRRMKTQRERFGLVQGEFRWMVDAEGQVTGTREKVDGDYMEATFVDKF